MPNFGLPIFTIIRLFDEGLGYEEIYMNTFGKLGDDAILRIKDSVEECHSRKASRHQEPIKKMASKIPEPVIPMIKVAGINEIPKDFERIGTGFYRQGHHLWELSPDKDGFILIRKHGEDHVLGYDPEPALKFTEVSDRFGKAIKSGSRVLIPHHGKVANATVVIVQPGALQVEMMSGETIGIPPDMTEVCEEPFNPEVEPSSKAEPEMIEQEPEQQVTSKVAAPPEPQVEPQLPPKAIPPQLPTQSKRSELLAILESAPDGSAAEIHPASGKYSFLVRKANDDKYELFTVEAKTDQFATYNKKQIIDWEFSMRQNAGKVEFRKASSIATSLMNKISNLMNTDDVVNWNDYWYELGQHMAAGTRVPLTPEQKENRKQRRKERKLERIGLPKGVKLPPKLKEQKQPKAGAKNTDQLAQMKDRLNLLEQTLDQIKFLVQDDSMRENEEQFVTELENTISEYEEQMEEIDKEQEEKIDDHLSIETPPENAKAPLIEQPKTSKRVRVSMSDLD